MEQHFPSRRRELCRVAAAAKTTEPAVTSSLPGLLPSVPSVRLQFSCRLQPKSFPFSTRPAVNNKQSPVPQGTVHFLYWAHCPDECHGLEGTLIRMGRVAISPSQCRRVGLRQDHFYGIKSEEQAERDLISFRDAAKNCVFEDSQETRKFQRKAESVQLALDSGDWHYWQEDRNFVVTPMKVHQAAAKLFERADQVLLMSATVGKIQPFLSDLGIAESEVGYHRISKSFPAENRMVEYYAVGNMSYRTQPQALPNVVEACRVTLREHAKDKGLILCSSYSLQKALAQGLQEFKDRLIVHQSKDRNISIQRHCDSKKPTVLLGVAMTEGLDLVDEHARFLIIPKVPYPSLKDPYVEGRMKRDAWWYPRQTALALIQGVGRVVRTPTDHAKIYVFDMKFWDFLAEHEDLFPAWFLDAVTEVNPSTGIGTRRPHKVKPIRRGRARRACKTKRKGKVRPGVREAR